MQGDINSLPSLRRVLAEKATERIKRILDWHTDAERACRPYGRKISSRNVEWIGGKWHSGRRRIKIRARIFEVGKHCQVFVAQVACERTVVHLTVSRRQIWCDGGEVIGGVVSVQALQGPIKETPPVIELGTEHTDIKWRSGHVGS